MVMTYQLELLNHSCMVSEEPEPASGLCFFEELEINLHMRRLAFLLLRGIGYEIASF